MTGFATAIQILGGLLTPVIAILAAHIAWQQHKTARDKLKLDLFERRYRVYRGLMDLLATIAANETVSDEDLGKFYRETDQKRFLFGNDIFEYLKEVREKALKLRQAHRLVAASHDRGQTMTQAGLSEAIEKQLDLTAWFEEQIEVAGRKFEKYLSFKENL